VFDAFVQTRTGQERREGTGLGLTISYNYVKLMGGELRLESEEGRGTEASFEISVGVPADSLVLDEVHRGGVAALAPGQDTFRILVADDRWASRHLITRILEPLGFEVREACDGAEAVAVWKQWRPHLICMDVRMPGVDGCEATRRIRSDPDGNSTVIIAVTASSYEEDRTHILASGCNGYMRKPFDEAELFDLLHQHLGLRFLYDEAQPGPAAAGNNGAGGLEKTMASLPLPLRAALHNALIELDTEAVSRALSEIHAYNSEMSNALQALTDNYQYGRLLRMMENSSDAKEVL
jgi:CheY-like chemotaxis protein